ncbi:hypothetical protein K1W54_25120 [Micromonospora sp. CPCC 205371]|nr:hypothetical protein [Micromonospora sp. CPCC 205371]
MAVPRVLVGFALGVTAVVIVVSLCALASPSTPLEPGEIVVLTGADESVGGQRQRLIDEWNDDHPDNPARLESLSSEADRQHSEMVARARAARYPLNSHRPRTTCAGWPQSAS